MDEIDRLIPRLRERAADPMRRTDAPQSVSFSGPGGTIATQFGDLGGMLAGGGYGAAPGPGVGGTLGLGSLGALLSDLQRVVDANQAGRPIDDDVRQRVDGMAAGFSTDNTTPLPPPATDSALIAAEARLGRPFPPALRRVYLEVADGGFGPGGGIIAADRAVE